MRKYEVVGSLLLIASFLPALVTGAPTASEIAILDGISVDFRLVTKQEREAVTPSLLKQLEMVRAANLPASIVEFVQSISIVVDPAMLAMTTNGQYMSNANPPHVRIKPIALPVDRAIVLHELMHAYRYQVLKEYTPDIVGAFRRAQMPGIYPAEYRDAAFLKNMEEYFANMATTFLLGRSERPPYSCVTIRTVQPKFVSYLESLFGPHPCA